MALTKSASDSLRDTFIQWMYTHTHTHTHTHLATNTERFAIMSLEREKSSKSLTFNKNLRKTTKGTHPVTSFEGDDMTKCCMLASNTSSFNGCLCLTWVTTSC